MVVCVLPRRRRLHATLSRPALANKGWERLVTHQPTVASAPPCVRTTTVTRCACMVVLQEWQSRVAFFGRSSLASPPVSLLVLYCNQA